MSFQLAPLGADAIDDAAVSACSRCFMDLVRELIVYLDRMIAVQRVTMQKTIVPTAIHDITELQVFVNKRLEDSYNRVARDSRLKNPIKVEKFPEINELTRKTTLSDFAIRRCLEQHVVAASEVLALYTIKLTLFAGDHEITSLPYCAAEGTQIGVRVDEVVRAFPDKSPVRLTETDVEGVYFTIQNVIAPEVRRALGDQVSRNRPSE